MIFIQIQSCDLFQMLLLDFRNLDSNTFKPVCNIYSGLDWTIFTNGYLPYLTKMNKFIYAYNTCRKNIVIVIYNSLYIRTYLTFVKQHKSDDVCI